MTSNIFRYSSYSNNLLRTTMTSSYYPKTSDHIKSSRYYSSDDDDDDDDDDLDALRKAALQSLYSKKRRKLSSRSNSTPSSRSRSPSLSSISSDSLDKNDKDYRFEVKSKDIDERFPQENNDDDDLLVVNCPIQDDLLLKTDKQQIKLDHDERRHSSIEQQQPSPLSVTVKFDSIDFDLRQLIKKRRIDQATSQTNRVVKLEKKHSNSK